MHWERTYRDLAQLLETMPELDYKTAQTTEVIQWLGRAYALVDETNNGMDSISMKTAVNRLRTGAWESGVHEIKAIVYRAWGIAERKVPPGVAGAFIPAGGDFDAFAAVSKVFQTATRDLMIIDAYLDQVILTDFASSAAERVQLRLLTDEATMKPTLQPAAERWIKQHGANRPLTVRIAPSRSLHDRAFFVDGSTVWLVSQSLKDLAARAHATIAKADQEVTAAKLAAYEAIWASARPLL